MSEETKKKVSESRRGTPAWNKGLKGKAYKDHFKNGLGGTFKNGHKPWHKGKKVPSRSGPNSHLWKGGITSENKRQRDSLESKQWRISVFERDNYTCVWCGATQNLNADHIKPWAFFPELRFDVNNGRTLCEPCHEETSTFMARKVNIESVSNIRPEPFNGMARGIRKTAEIIGSTLGPAGGNVSLQEKLEPKHQIINDGATLVSRILFKDELEQMGHDFLREATERSNVSSGDGSSTTVCILNSLLQEGIKQMKGNGISRMQLKEELDACLPLIEKEIDSMTKSIGVEDVPAVAAIASEDVEVAQILGEIYKKIGKEGIIHLEGSGSYQTSFQLIEGVRFVDTGMLSPYMVNDEGARKAGRKESRAVYEKPSILVTKRKIENIGDIEPLLQALIAKGEKTLVIFTDDMDSNVARLLVELQKNPKRSLNILIIKAPTLWKQYVFDDFSKITGSAVVEDAAGINFKNLELAHLGTCGTLIVDKEETTVIGIHNIGYHIEELKKENTTDSKLRLSWLTTKTAILKLGAKSETELSWRKYKCEDAIHSSRLALKAGVVIGGGACLLNVSNRMPSSLGGKILAKALKAPIIQIMHNAGQATPMDGGFDGMTFTSETMGYDAKSRKIVDMFEANIIDSAEVVKNACRNSLGIASTLLTIHAAIVLPPELRPTPQTFPWQN